MKRIKHDIELKQVSESTKKAIFALCFKEERSAVAKPHQTGYTVFLLNVTKNFTPKFSKS